MSNRSCGEWSEWIIDRLADELPEREAILLEQHLSECPRCAREEHGLRAMIRPEATLEPFTVSPCLEGELLRSFRDRHAAWRWAAAKGGTAPPRRGLIRLLLRPIPVYAVLALLVAACFSGLWAGRQGESGGASEAMRSTPAMAPMVRPATGHDSLIAGGAARMWRGGGVVAAPSDAVCLVGILGHDTL